MGVTTVPWYSAWQWTKHGSELVTINRCLVTLFSAYVVSDHFQFPASQLFFTTIQNTMGTMPCEDLIIITQLY